MRKINKNPSSSHCDSADLCSMPSWNKWTQNSNSVHQILQIAPFTQPPSNAILLLATRWRVENKKGAPDVATGWKRSHVSAVDWATAWLHSLVASLLIWYPTWTALNLVSVSFYPGLKSASLSSLGVKQRERRWPERNVWFPPVLSLQTKKLAWL